MTSPSASPADPLLDLYRCAGSAAPGEFEHLALGRLARQLRFDGAVWGDGVATADHVRIERATVMGRSQQLLKDYADLPVIDPVTSRFISNPFALQRVSVEPFYRDPSIAAVREMCDTHQIGHLMLQGCRDSATGRLHWLTLYRNRREPAFSARDASTLSALLPHWIQARGICEQLHPRPLPDSGAWKGAIAFPPATRAQAWSARQQQVLLQLALGRTYKQIGRSLGLSDETVKDYVRVIYRKMGVHNKTAAAAEARIRGLLG